MISRRNRAKGHPLLEVILIVVVLGVFSGPALKSALFAEEPPPDSRRANVIIPNIDDDDGDGLPDAAAEVLSGALEDDLLGIVLTPPDALPDDAMLRVEVENPWTSVSRVLLCDPSNDVFRPFKGPARVGRDETARKGITIGCRSERFRR